MPVADRDAVCASGVVRIAPVRAWYLGESDKAKSRFSENSAENHAGGLLTISLGRYRGT